MATGGGTAITSEETNHLRAVYLCYVIAPEAVRNFFDGIHPNLASDLIGDKTSLLHLYQNKHVIKPVQWDTLFPAGQPAQVSKDFDVTLLICLLRNMHPKVKPPPLGFDRNPGPKDNSDGAELARIKFYRNYLAHSTCGKVQDTEFNIIWTALEDVSIISMNFDADDKIRCKKQQQEIETKHSEEGGQKGFFSYLVLQILNNFTGRLDSMPEKKGAINGLTKNKYITKMNEAKSLSISGCMEDFLKKILYLENRHELTSQTLMTMITELQKRAVTAQENVYGIKKEIKEIRKTQITTIPQNILEQCNDTLGEWKEMNKKFTERHAVGNVLACLKENNSVTVTGSSGTGKTALVRFVACVMKEEGYFIVPTTEPGDIRRFSKKQTKMLFVFDDVCGNYSMDMHAYEIWYQKRHEIESLLRGGDNKIISTCRLEISKDDNFKKISVLNDCISNLSSPDLDLTHAEKSNMARVTFKENSSRSVELLGKYDCFPLLCSLYQQQETCNAESFINNPFNFYKEELDDISSRREEGKLKFCCLALCVVYNNKLNLLSLKNQSRRDVIEDVLEECELYKGTPPKLLIRSAKNLVGSYFVEDINSYRTIHDKLFDFLSFYMGSKMIELIIKHAPSDFVSERLVCGSDACNVCSRDEFDILVTDKHFDAYVKRLKSDLLDSKIIHVLSKRNLKCPSISKLLLESLQNLTEVEKTKLINMEDRLGQSILFHCCQAGNLEFTRWIIHIGADINETDDVEENSCLHIAAIYDHTEIVDELIQKRAIKIDVSNDIGKTPLHMACKNGNVKVVKELLARGADINRKCRLGGSPVSAASSKGHVNVVRVLLEKGAKHIDLGDIYQQTPLFLACKNGHLNVVKELLKSGVDINQCDKYGNSPLHASLNSRKKESTDMHNQRSELARELLKNDSIKNNLCNRNGQTPLHVACTNQYFTVVQELLKHVADINTRDKDGNSALHEAIGLSNFASKSRSLAGKYPLKISEEHMNYAHSINGQMVDSLLMNDNIDIHICNKQGDTPLHLACEHNHVHVVKDLLRMGAFINEIDIQGNSPLHRAVINSSKDAVDELLKENTININLYNKKGNTPLHLACSKCSKKKAYSLSKRDPDNIYCKDHYLVLPDGGTPRYAECDSDSGTISLALIARGANINKCDRQELSPLHMASANCQIRTVQELLSHEDIKIDACDSDGNTSLHLACQRAKVIVITELIQRGASINKVNDKGDSPLHIAIFNSNEAVVDELLKEDNIDIDYSNDKGETPLHYACENGLTTVVTELLQRGASINKVDKKGDSPLHQAILKDNEKIIDELLKKDNIDIDVCNYKVESPLHFACRKALTMVVKDLINRRASINKVNDKGDSPLHIAINLRVEELINEFLKAGNIDISICNKEGNRPLHNACRNGLTEVVKELITMGTSINQVNHNGCSPLHIAIHNEHDNVITELLKEDTIDLEVCNKQGNTPLHLSCYMGCNKKTSSLFEGEGDISLYAKDQYSSSYKRKIPSNQIDPEKQNTALILIERGVDINKCDCKGRSPLHLASKMSKFEIVEKLLQHEESKIDICDQRGNTPLNLACRSGNVKIVKALILRRASLTKVNAKGNSPLHTAIIKGNDSVVDELLKENSIGLELCNKEGNTPLHLSCSKIDKKESSLDRYETHFDTHSDSNNVEKALTIIARGVDINKCDNKGRPPLHIAMENRKIEIVDEIIKHAELKINLCDQHGNTPLRLACQYGEVKVIKELIKRGASINEVDNEDQTLLHIAISYGNEEVIHELLKEDTINIDTCNRERNTQLHYACRQGLVKVVTELILRGASINVVDNKGDSPLHTAIINSNADVINELLNKDNITIDVCNNEGNTPLHLSCSMGYTEKKILSSKQKADMNRQRKNGQSMFEDEKCLTQLNTNSGFDDEMTALTLIAKGVNIKKCNGKKRSALHISSEKGKFKIVQELLIRGVNIDLRDERGNTPLHLACQNGHVIVTKKLIQSGAAINNANYEGDSALHLAISNSYEVIINELLKEKTIEIDVTNDKGNTPLHCACTKELVKVVKELILRGASINRVNNNGETPLHRAVINRREAIVNELLMKSNIEINVYDNKGNTPLVTLLLEETISILAESFDDFDSDDGEHDAKDDVGDDEDSDDEEEEKEEEEKEEEEKEEEKEEEEEDDDDDDYDDNYFFFQTFVEKIALSLLDRGADFYQCDGKGRSPLHIASIMGFLEIVLVLLQDTNTINLCDYSGNTPLHLACQYDEVIVAKELLLHGASINSTNNDGESPLHKAADSNSWNVLNALLNEETIDIDISNKFGNTPLHYASSVGHVEVVNKLIRRGASINKLNNEGHSPLRIAVIYDNDYVISELLQKDTIDIDACNKARITPLDCAFQVEDDGYSPLHKAIIVADEDVINNLLKEDTTEVDVCDEKGNTPLHHACENELVEVVKNLILIGASINKVNNEGFSPLHVAVIAGKVDIIKELLSDDTIDVDVCNNEGNTPLHVACELGYHNCVTELIRKGASINKVAGDGKTPFQRAFFYGNENVIDELLNHGNLDQFN